MWKAHKQNKWFLTRNQQSRTQNPTQQHRQQQQQQQQQQVELVYEYEYYIPLQEKEGDINGDFLNKE